MRRDLNLAWLFLLCMNALEFEERLNHRDGCRHDFLHASQRCLGCQFTTLSNLVFTNAVFAVAPAHCVPIMFPKTTLQIIGVCQQHPSSTALQHSCSLSLVASVFSIRQALGAKQSVCECLPNFTLLFFTLMSPLSCLSSIQLLGEPGCPPLPWG